MVTFSSSSTFVILASGLCMANVASSKFITNLHARQQQAAGTPLFLNEPACNSYQCDIDWYPGQNVTANWLDPPEGNVILDMMEDAGATFGYNVATVPGTTSNCDATGGTTCGSFSWIVPSAWLNGTTYGNYSLRASSANNQSIESYTDIILVKPNGTSTQNIPFKALDPTVGSGNSTSSSVTSTGAPTSTGGSSAQSTGGTSAASSPSQSSKSGTNSAPSLYQPAVPVIAAFSMASVLAGIAFVL